MVRMLAFFVTIAFCTSGCATAPVGYDRSLLADVRTIAILPPEFPDHASVIRGPDANSGPISLGTGGLGGGGKSLAGAGPGPAILALGAFVALSAGVAAVEAVLQSEREAKLKSVLEQQRFSADEEFLQRLTQGLAASGYMVSTLSIPRPSSGFLKQNISNTNADAVLDIVVGRYGYYASASRGEKWAYRPQFSLTFRLIRTKDSFVLIEKTVLFNPDVGPFVDGGSTLRIAPSSAPEFDDFAAVERAQELAVRGLADAAQKTADALSGEVSAMNVPGSFYLASAAQDSAAKQFAGRPGECSVYAIYTSGGAWLFDSGEPIAYAYFGGYSVIALDPGWHQIALLRDTTYINSKAKLDLFCPAGGVVYIDVTYKSPLSGGWFPRPNRLESLSESDGRKAMLRSRRVINPAQIASTDIRPILQF